MEEKWEKEVGKTLNTAITCLFSLCFLFYYFKSLVTSDLFHDKRNCKFYSKNIPWRNKGESGSNSTFCKTVSMEFSQQESSSIFCLYLHLWCLYLAFLCPGLHFRKAVSYALELCQNNIWYLGLQHFVAQTHPPQHGNVQWKVWKRLVAIGGGSIFVDEFQWIMSLGVLIMT